MRIVNRLFGTKLTTRLTKGLFYIAWLSMIPMFFNANWMNVSMPLMLLSFFTVGLFSALANKDSLIDFWGSDAKVERDLSDPLKSATAVRSFRIVGIMFMVLIPYITFDYLHQQYRRNTPSTTRR
jgi:hypothetical protein